MKQQAQHHLCNLCNGEPVGDLILYERGRDPNGKPLTMKRQLIRHLYLCQTHYEDMLDFLSTYTGEDEYF